MSTDRGIRRMKLWVLAVAVFAICMPGPLESGTARTRRECIAGCRDSRKECVGTFKVQHTTARAICDGIRGKADRKRCKRDLKPQKAAFSTGKQDCKREFKENCKQCCKEDPTEDCRNTSFVVCGDGNPSGVEDCDDGNRNDGDGCSRTCRLEARCGDGTVDPNEECETRSDCSPNERCVACRCRPDCEDDRDCETGETCVGGACIPPLGTRTFSAHGEGLFASAWLDGSASLGDVVGSLTLHAAAPDTEGVAEIITPSGPYFFHVDILGGLQGRLCVRISGCRGNVACAGGRNVDVTVERDSLRNGETDPCEGGGEGGNDQVVRQAVNTADSGAGAALLECAGSMLQVKAGADCGSSEYAPDSSFVLTTGTNGATMLNHCGNLSKPVTITKTGENFDCDAWQEEDGKGKLVFTELNEEPVAGLGDSAQAGVLDD